MVVQKALLGLTLMLSLGLLTGSVCGFGTRPTGRPSITPPPLTDGTPGVPIPTISAPPDGLPTAVATAPPVVEPKPSQGGAAATPCATVLVSKAGAPYTYYGGPEGPTIHKGAQPFDLVRDVCTGALSEFDPTTHAPLNGRGIPVDEAEPTEGAR